MRPNPRKTHPDWHFAAEFFALEGRAYRANCNVARFLGTKGHRRTVLKWARAFHRAAERRERVAVGWQRYWSEMMA